MTGEDKIWNAPAEPCLMIVICANQASSDLMPRMSQIVSEFRPERIRPN